MSRLRVADDITQLVGETPMLQLKRLVPAGSADVFAKLEYLNPGGSVKDRAAIGIIRRAEQEKKLVPGGTIVEATAGNTGIGLALIGVNRGYKVKLFVPENFSQEKARDTIHSILEKISSLEKFSQVGKISTLSAFVRELVIEGNIIFYQTTDETIDIVFVKPRKTKK